MVVEQQAECSSIFRDFVSDWGLNDAARYLASASAPKLKTQHWQCSREPMTPLTKLVPGKMSVHVHALARGPPSLDSEVVQKHLSPNEFSFKCCAKPRYAAAFQEGPSFLPVFRVALTQRRASGRWQFQPDKNGKKRIDCKECFKNYTFLTKCPAYFPFIPV